MRPTDYAQSGPPPTGPACWFPFDPLTLLCGDATDFKMAFLSFTNTKPQWIQNSE